MLVQAAEESFNAGDAGKSVELTGKALALEEADESTARLFNERKELFKYWKSKDSLLFSRMSAAWTGFGRSIPIRNW